MAPISAIAIDARGDLAVGHELKCVPRSVVGLDLRVVAADELHKLPGRTAKAGTCRRLSGARCSGGEQADCECDDR